VPKGGFEDENKVLEPSIIIINYCIIIQAYVNYIVNVQYNYSIANKGLFEECDKEENVAITGAATTSCFKRIL
jgi:hypothetical protein